MLLEMVVVVAVNTLYCGLLCLAVVLSDPFGDDVIDFPQALFLHRLWKAQHFASSLAADDEDVDLEVERLLEDATIPAIDGAVSKAPENVGERGTGPAGSNGELRNSG